MFKQVTIIGFGLIGSSIARGILKHNLCERLICADASQEVCNKVAELGIADGVTTDIAAGVEDSDLVILCVPVGAMDAVSRRAGLFGAFASTFLLTLTNPMTILSFVAVFAALGLGTTNPDPLSAAGLVVGVFVGSALWWLTLSAGVSLFRSRFDERGLRWVNRLSGAIIVAFGLAAIASLLFPR